MAKRHLLQHLVDTSMSVNKTAPAPVWALINKGVTSLTENFNATESDEQYINDEQGSHSVDSYAPSLEIDLKAVKDSDEATVWFKKIINEKPIGEDAQTQYIRVDLSEPATSGAYPAYCQKCTVTANSIGGDAGSYISYSLKLAAVGDVIKGTFNPSTKKFTAAA